MANCTIVIEQIEGTKCTQEVFSFDDYRVATAISNLLHNIENVKFGRDYYNVEQKEG